MLNLILCITLALGLSALSGCKKRAPERHKHEYTAVVTEPTCNMRGYTTYTCECGRKYVDNYTDALGHNYENDKCTRCGAVKHDHIYTRTVIEPDCENGGYTRGVCDICGASFNIDFTDPLGHDFVNGKCIRCDKAGYTDGLEYELVHDGTYYSCTGIGTATDTTIVIAPEYNGKPVKAIQGYAFTGKECNNVQTVIIPNSVTHIGNRSFQGCVNMESITIPESVTDVGMFTFWGCSGLTVYCEAKSKPKGWIEIWDTWRSYDVDVASISGKIPVVWDCKNNSVDGHGYTYTITDGIKYGLKDGSAAVARQIRNIAGELTLPQTVTYEGETYPVTSIKEAAFYYCDALLSVAIPDGLTSIESGAFYFCDSLTMVTIPDSVTFIDYFAFIGCHSITIYCDVKNRPPQWDEVWNGNCPVVWDYKNATHDEYLRYTLSDDGTYYICSGIIDATYATFVIPSVHDGIPVKEIGERAFSGCANVTGVIIEKGVVTIGNYAFYNCISLKRITIPDSVISIGDYASYNCRELTEITIPGSVTSIGDYAFNSCTKLTDIIIPGSVTSIGESAFSSCTGLTRVTICDGVSSISENMFRYCISLTTVSIPDTVISIGDGVFLNCNKLNGIYYNGTQLQWNEIVKHESWKTGTGNFIIYCTDGRILSDGTYIHTHNYSKQGTVEADCVEGGHTIFTCDICGDSYNEYHSDRLGHDFVDDRCTRCGIERPTQGLEFTLSDDGEYYVCTGPGTVTEVDIFIPAEYNGKPVKAIGEDAFAYCENILSTVIPETVTAIGERAFYGCNRLESIDMPTYLTSLGARAFYGCNKLKSIEIPRNITSIEESMFYGCRKLESIVIPDKVTSIGQYAFDYCVGLKSIIVPSSVSFIGYCAFEWCNSLTVYCEAEFQPSGWNDTWKGVFSSCEVVWDYKNYGSYTHGLKYTLSGDGTYYICAGIGIATDAEIIIPSRYNGLPVMAIGNSAFSNIKNLTSVTIPYGVTEIGRSSFSRCINLKTVNIPDSVTSVGYRAFYGCEGLTTIIIPASVESIGESAFGDCYALTVYCEAQSKPDGWSEKWNVLEEKFDYPDWGVDIPPPTAISTPEPSYPEPSPPESSVIKYLPVVWDSDNNDIADDGYIYTVIGGIRYALKDGQATVVRQAKSGVTVIEIPRTINHNSTAYKVTEICEKAFYDFTELTSIRIPGSVTVIGEQALYGCLNLEDIHYGASAAMWGLVEKCADWDKNTGNYKLHFLEMPG